MYGQSVSHSDGYNKMMKPNIQHHLSTTGNRHSSSHFKDARKNENIQRQKTSDKVPLQRTSSHSSKPSHEHNKQHKVQGALKSCGIWSKHRSSSGKIYFYNSVSEISQWEKPKEWEDGTPLDVKTKDKAKSSSQRAITKTSRHGSTSKVNSSANSSGDVDKDYRSQKDYCDRDYRSRPSTSDHDYKDMDYRNAGAVAKNIKNNVRRSISTDKDYRSLNASSNLHAVANHTGNAPIKQENYVPSTGKFYDYSSWNTSNSHGDSKAINGVSISDKVGTSRKGSEGGDSCNSNDSNKQSATSEFVRKLSNALSQAASTSGTNSIKSEENIKDVFQLLLNVASKNHNDNTADTPSTNETPDQNVSNGEPPEKRPRVAEESYKNAESKKNEGNSQSTSEEGIEEKQFRCLDELRPFFDLPSISHVQNWPAEHSEKQCVRFSDDFHRFIADHMSELSVKLTTSRSRVRTSEILSTLHEQRVLYIRQQIKDLEKTSASAAPFT